MGFIRNAVIGSVLDFVEKTRKTLAVKVATAIVWAKAWLPTTIEPVTQAVRGGYTAITVAITKWLDKPAGVGTDGKPKPSTIDRLTTMADQLLARIEKIAKDAK